MNSRPPPCGPVRYHVGVVLRGIRSTKTRGTARDVAVTVARNIAREVCGQHE